MKSLLLNLLLGDHINSYKKAKKIENYSYDEIKELQHRKLLSLSSFLLEKNSYYKEIGIDKLKSINDLQKLPFLTKKIIRSRFNDLKSIGIDSKRFLKNSTSGSTGEATYFFSDTKYLNDSLMFRGDSWTGWNPGESKIVLWGAERDMKMNFTRRLKNSWLLMNNRILSSYHMTNADMDEYVRIINKRKPKLIVGYPSSLMLFSEFIINTNQKIYSPKGIITGGETLYEFQRETIQKAFHTKVLNRYGTREVQHIANECEIQNGLHISSDHIIVEVINENGYPCKPGELGEIVVTNLDNYVFPFIRYKIGDLGVLSDRTCSCERAFPLLERVEGRTFDLVIGSNGNRVLGTFFTILSRKIKGINKFQLYQRNIGEIKLLLETNNLFDESQKARLLTQLKEKLGVDTIIDIEIVEEIPVSKTGKHRWVVSNVSPFSNY